MKWFQRTDFIKELRKLEKELKLPHLDVQFHNDHKLQLYMQKLIRLKKSAK